MNFTRSSASREIQEHLMEHTNGRGVPLDPATNILPTILDAIGNTPLVRLNRLPEMLGLKCEVVAKCEFLNPGGSVKDRVASRMIIDAMRSGRLKENDVLIEPTSGNTGVGMAMTTAVTGHRLVITLPKKMSSEKQSILHTLGAEVIRTPTEAAHDSPESNFGVARSMQQQDPEHHHVLDQFENESNISSHVEGTAAEILRQCNGKVDVIVLGAGTGGTITGIARYFRQHSPKTVIVGVDPEGSILADPEHDRSAPYQVEGIGYDFVPGVLHRDLVHRWVKTNDVDAFRLTRQLHYYEGLLCGGSSGSALSGVVQVAHDLGPDQRVVVLFADGVRNYMTKLLDDNWMMHYGYMEGVPQRLPISLLEQENTQLKQKLKELESEIAQLKGKSQCKE